MRSLSPPNTFGAQLPKSATVSCTILFIAYWFCMDMEARYLDLGIFQGLTNFGSLVISSASMRL